MSAKKKLLKSLRTQPIGSREEATAVAIGTVAIILERDKVLAEKNAKVESVSLSYSVQLDGLNDAIAQKEMSLLSWAKLHRNEEFGDVKTIYLGGHKLAFREGTGKLGVVGEMTEAEVIQAIIDHEDEALAERYLTVKPALDKNAILTALRNDPKQAEFFKTLGLEMVKEEKLTFEPDLEAAPASQTQAA